MSFKRQKCSLFNLATTMFSLAGNIQCHCERQQEKVAFFCLAGKHTCSKTEGHYSRQTISADNPWCSLSTWTPILCMCHQREWEWGSSALTSPPPKIKQQPDTQNVELNVYGNVTVCLINTNPLGNIFKEIIKHENQSFLTFLLIVATNINFK